MSYQPKAGLRAIFAAYEHAKATSRPVPTMLMATIESAQDALEQHEQEERDRYAHLNAEARAEEREREEATLHPERFV